MDIMWPSAARRASTAISIGSSYGSIYSTSSTNSASDPDASAVSSILDEALLEEGRALMSQAAAKLVDSGEPDLEEILELFNSALTKCPSLLPDMWVRGFTLYYLGKHQDAADQFHHASLVDPDDVEPVLWRYLCEARLIGWKAAKYVLYEFEGLDRRLCMMSILELFKGENIKVEEILACANGDRHSSHRASFACALFFEAQQDEDLALPLLYKAAGLDSPHPSNPPPIPPYLTRLARVHLRQLQRRLVVQGTLPPSRAPAPWAVASFWTKRYKAGRAAVAVRYSSSC